MAYFQAQQRAVTKEDYITRVYALPPAAGFGLLTAKEPLVVAANVADDPVSSNTAFENLIQYRNLPISEFVASDGNVEFFPGNHIRAMGYQSGVFNVKYNFLRRLAGDESAVLTHTINKSSTKIGDV